ncbi:MAG: hypothetical protein Q9225_007201 [Loekoesia sp. 1 TL-2023]
MVLGLRQDVAQLKEKTAQLKEETAQLKEGTAQLKQNVATLQEKDRRVTTRDIINNLCLTTKTTCTGEPKLHCPPYLKTRSGDHQSRRDAHHYAHWASVKDAHTAIEEYFTMTTENFLKNAILQHDGEQQDVIKRYTLEDVQQMVTSVSPKEFQAMSGKLFR